MNLDLARAIRKFGDSRTGREILYFELLRAVPLLQEIASLWLAEVPREGSTRQALAAFLEPRLDGRNTRQIIDASGNIFRRCLKLTSPKPAVYVPVWTEPPIEAFCYALAVLYPEPTMVKVDLFAGLPILRAMLWPQPAIEGLLKQAEQLGHISKISQLDQYHQFTLAGTGQARLKLLLADQHDEAAGVLPLFGPDPPSQARRPPSRNRSSQQKPAQGSGPQPASPIDRTCHGPDSGDTRTFFAPER